MIELREYQVDAINRLRSSMSSGNKRVILQAACGAGKTVMFADIAKKAYEKGHKILFLANRRELIFQAKKTLELCGVTCGVIMAGEESNLSAQVQIASQQTYVRRMDLDDLQFNQWWHDATLICCDECHSSLSPSFRKILNNYEGKHIIGLTATACRGDGRGLGELYDDIVQAVSIKHLIETNNLVPMRYFAPSTPDLEGIKTVAGDYDKKQLGERVNTAKLVGDIYDNWSVICPSRPTIIFATNVKHSIFIRDLFCKNDVIAVHVDARTPPEERADALDRLKRGMVQVITNVGILCEGFDFPEASCIVLARPTKSLGLYIQMAGRGARISKNKEDCIILDHSGCVENHGFIEDDREWSLDGKQKAWKEKEAKDKEKKPMKCPSCHSVVEGVSTCPTCGSEMRRFGKPVETVDGDLVEMNGKKNYTMADKRRWFGMCVYYQRQKGYSDGWTSHKYKEKIGVWPRGMADVMPIQPDQMFYNFIRHLQIKHAKSKQSVAIVNGP